MGAPGRARESAQYTGLPGRGQSGTGYACIPVSSASVRDTVSVWYRV